MNEPDPVAVLFGRASYGCSPEHETYIAWFWLVAGFIFGALVFS